jgi:hypothetical protein
MWLQGNSATLSSTVKFSQQIGHRGLAFLCSEFICIVVTMVLWEEEEAEEEGVWRGRMIVLLCWITYRWGYKVDIMAGFGTEALGVSVLTDGLECVFPTTGTLTSSSIKSLAHWGQYELCKNQSEFLFLSKAFCNFVLTLETFWKTSSHMWQKKVVLREFSLFGNGLGLGGGSVEPWGEETADTMRT